MLLTLRRDLIDPWRTSLCRWSLFQVNTLSYDNALTLNLRPITLSNYIIVHPHLAASHAVTLAVVHSITAVTLRSVTSARSPILLPDCGPENPSSRIPPLHFQ